MTQLTILASVLAGFAAILGLAFLMGRRAGVNEIKSDDNQEAVSRLHREQAAAAVAPQTKDAVIERLRHGGGI